MVGNACNNGQQPADGDMAISHHTLMETLHSSLNESLEPNNPWKFTTSQHQKVIKPSQTIHQPNLFPTINILNLSHKAEKIILLVGAHKNSNLVKLVKIDHFKLQNPNLSQKPTICTRKCIFYVFMSQHNENHTTTPIATVYISFV